MSVDTLGLKELKIIIEIPVFSLTLFFSLYLLNLQDLNSGRERAVSTSVTPGTTRHNSPMDQILESRIPEHWDVPWVPEVFLALFGRRHERRKKLRGRAFEDSKPETAHEKPLAPRATEMTGSLGISVLRIWPVIFWFGFRTQKLWLFGFSVLRCLRGFSNLVFGFRPMHSVRFFWFC